MVARGRLVGVIDLQSTRLNAYGNYERAMLRLIAGRVAATIDNARLYRRVERQNKTLRTLRRLSQGFSSILDLDELLGRIADSVRLLIPSDSFSILLLDKRAKVLRHRFSRRVDERGSLDNIPLGKGITGAAAESKEAVRVPDTLADPRYLPFHPGIRSEVAVPLVVRDRVIGVMDLESERVGFFTEDHVRTLSLLAPQIASSIENAQLYQELAERERRMESDLHAAREVQTMLLPRRPPEVEGLEVAAGLLPAREISGDLYDFFVHSDEHVVIAMGDVSGKGAAAALYGALVSGLLRTMAPRNCEPSLLLMSLNEALIERKVDARYVTLLVLVWHPRKGEFRMANAGAFPPLICRAGEIIKPRVEGLPLGLLDAREYGEVSFETRPGDVVVLYSDGIVDQNNLAGQDYGRRRLASLLQQHWREPAQAIVDAILIDVDHFGAGAGTTDDQTVVVMKVTG
jgi:sigma-B regulation protein RsbU (phosphoserine phosphatase)